jgi:uncharacterized membrane protein YhhN
MGDVAQQLGQFKESFFHAGAGCFLLAQLIYALAFLLTPGKNVLFFRKIYLLVPVALYGWGILSLLPDGLGDMKLPVTVCTVVVLSMLLAAINREQKVNRQSFLLVLAGAVIFVVSNSILAINKFAQPFELAGIASMSSYITAQYLIAVGSTRQFNLTIK